jgi:hypothetical protein
MLAFEASSLELALVVQTPQARQTLLHFLKRVIPGGFFEIACPAMG